MKIRTLIKKLQKLEQKHGNIEATVHDLGLDGEQQNPKAICTITWFDGEDKANKKGKKKAYSVMLCSPETAHELS